MKDADASKNFMFITFVSIFASALGVSLSFLRIPIFIVICNGLATRDVRIYLKREAESILIQIMCKEKEFSIFIFKTQHFLCHRNVNGQYTIVLLFEFSLLLSHPVQ